jgi:uncharacterized protein
MASGAYRKVSYLPPVIPVFPLDGALLLPGCVLPLQIFEPRYLNMIDDAMAGGRMIGMIQRASGGRTRDRLAKVGCAGRITSYSETGDGRYLIALTGVCRFTAGEEVSAATPYRQVRPDFTPFQADLAADEDATVEFHRTPFLNLLRRYLDQRGLGIEWDAVTAAPGPSLINSLCMALPFDPAEKQALLEAPGLEERRLALSALLEIGAAAGPDEDDDRPPSMQ